MSLGNETITRESICDGHIDKVVQWIGAKGPRFPSRHVPEGHVETMSRIWELIQTRKVMMEDLAKLETQYELDSKKIEKAKEFHMTRLLSKGVQNQSTIDQVESWSKSKLDDARKELTKLEGDSSKLNDSLNKSAKDFLMVVMQPLEDDQIDQDLLAELENLDVEMGTLRILDGPKVATPNDDGITMDSNSLALSHIRSLEDGPHKTALFAVLEAASVQARLL